MRKIYLFIVLLFVGGTNLFAQQDAMFTKYMFNSLTFNPAYAGSKDHLAMNLIHRTQWWGIEGAPQTQSLIIHTPMPNERVGVGLSLVNDEIGPTNSIRANLSYAYRIPMGKGKLSIGLQGGVMHWRADFNKLSLEQGGGDEAFEEMTPSKLLPNFGAGIYYYTPKFYVGFARKRFKVLALRPSSILICR